MGQMYAANRMNTLYASRSKEPAAAQIGASISNLYRCMDKDLVLPHLGHFAGSPVGQLAGNESDRMALTRRIWV